MKNPRDLSLTELADILQDAKEHPEKLQPFINSLREEAAEPVKKETHKAEKHTKK
ncbi:MAG: hypothetical protein ACYDG4_13180 [Desulfuromonadaceae bacterium]